MFDSYTAVKWSRSGEPVILVRRETNPDDLNGMIAANGILTSRGGKTSHAAVVVVRRVAEMNHRIGLGVADIVDDDGVVGRLGRDPLIVDDLDRRAGFLDEFAEGVGLRAGEFVG